MTTPANTALNTYEALVILKPIVDIDNSDVALKGVETLVDTLKGKIIRVDKLGRKRLGYEINKYKDAFVAAVYLELDPALVINFRRACKLNEDLLRVTLVRRCPKQLAQEAQRPAGPPFRSGDRPDHRGERPDFRGGDRPRFPRNDRAVS
ncbi:MAG: 30S ribosomal protein S6 [Vampirovibrionales bacterium]|nr:30S ribosomal protein S6 [Vampirovibrionales bacterium]